MDSYRSHKITIVSLLSVIAVVYIHSYNLKRGLLLADSSLTAGFGFTGFIQYTVSNGICRSAVPLLFLISGYLFFHRGENSRSFYVSSAAKRVRSLVVPYLIWSVAGMLLVLLLQTNSITYEGVDSNNYLGSKDLLWFFKRIFLRPVPFQLWYVRDLIIYAILAPAIHFMIRRFSYFAIAAFFATWFFDVHMRIVSNEGFCFFLIGATFAILRIDICRRFSLKMDVLLGLSWLLLVISKTVMAYHPSVLLLPIHKVMILSGIAFLWLVYDHLPEQVTYSKMLAYLVPFSFFIYAGHEPLLNAVTNLSLKFVGKSATRNMIVYCLAPVIVTTACVLTGHLLRSYAKPVFQLVTGNRGKIDSDRRYKKEEVASAVAS